MFFPRVEVANPLTGGTLRISSSGTVAGIMARIDGSRGVWKASAGVEAGLRGGTPTSSLTDLQNGELNVHGINVIRSLPVYGSVVWGARTLAGADAAASEWKYLPIRRLALFLEESLRQGLTWVVFEPNDEPLWGQIRLNVESFMQGLFSVVHSRARRRGRPTTSSAIVPTTRRATSIWKSSTSRSASRRCAQPNSSF